MNLNRISMDKQEAQRAFIQYRNAVRQKHDAIDEEIMRGYRALAKGHQLLALSQAIKAAGFHTRSNNEGEYWLPKLAVCRAHTLRCYVEVDRDGAAVFSEREWIGHRAPKDTVRRFPAGTLPRREAWGPRRASAMVPIIPPEFRPPHALSNYHILWEADWRPEPPVDPALLKHIGGDLYAVLATWDLTEVERAVLFGKR